MKTIAEFAETLKHTQAKKVRNPAVPELIDDVTPGKIITLKTLDTTWHPKVKQAVEMARAWQKRRQEGETNASMVLVASQMYESGQPDLDRTGFGCGKTHIAAAALWSNCYVLDGVPQAPSGRFFKADRIVQIMDADTQPKDEIGNSPIVVLDEVGSEQHIPYIAEKAQAGEIQNRYTKIVDWCYDVNRSGGVSLIITSNLGITELAQHIGGRAWSRLLEMAPAGFMLDMTGVPDYRRRQGGR